MAEKKVKLALMTSSYVGEGSSFIELVRRLDPEQFELIFISLKKRSGNPEGKDKDGHRVYYLTEVKRHNTFGLLILFRLVKILRLERVDILHVHRHRPSFFAAFASLFVKIPVTLVHVHGIKRTKNWHRKLQNPFLFGLFNKVIGCSMAVRDDVRKTNPIVRTDKIIALENSIDYDRYANVLITKSDARREKIPDIPQDAFIFGVVARFGPYKGHSFLLKAFASVKAKIPNAELLIIGDGPCRSEIENGLNEFGLCDSVHLLGRRNDVPELLRVLDVFVLPSIGSEGMPLSILEAMAAGVPCLSTSISGIPEVINSDDVGVVVEPANADALADAMMAYVEMTDQKKSLIIENARQRVKTHFSHEVLLGKIIELYENELKSS